MDNTIILRALEAELGRVMDNLNLTNDEYAVIFSAEPVSHVFYATDDWHEDDRESMEYVMDQDVDRKIRWITDTIRHLESPNVRAIGGILENAEGMADMQAMYEAERRAGC